MNKFNVNIKDADLELLRLWFEDLEKHKYEYKEPILDESTLNVLKIACDSFKQDIHVFITSVDILEDYIRVQNREQKKITEEILTLALVIFISSKYTGEQVDLKLKFIDAFLQKTTNIQYDYKFMRSLEIDILRSLGGGLPVTTVIDDLNTVVELYVRESKLRVNVRPLCSNILYVVYISRKKWFYELKIVYSQNIESLSVFKQLIRNKFYIPVAILLTALRTTNYKLMFNMEAIYSDMTNFSKIHKDHLIILSDKIVDIIRS